MIFKQLKCFDFHLKFIFFQIENIEVEELQKLTKDDLKEFFHKFISEDSKQRKKLAVFVYPPEMHDDIIKDQNVVKVIIFS